MKILAKLISGLTGAPLEATIAYFNKKQELKNQLKLTKIESKIKRASQESTWELEQIRNSGFKDEWVLFLLSIPLVLSFIPGVASYVLEGFSVLSNTPDWYRWLILVVFSAIYGVRIWKRRK